jgi:hypothetical protein
MTACLNVPRALLTMMLAGWRARASVRACVRLFVCCRGCHGLVRVFVCYPRLPDACVKRDNCTRVDCADREQAQFRALSGCRRSSAPGGVMSFFALRRPTRATSSTAARGQRCYL